MFLNSARTTRSAGRPRVGQRDLGQHDRHPNPQLRDLDLRPVGRPAARQRGRGQPDRHSTPTGAVADRSMAARSRRSAWRQHVGRQRHRRPDPASARQRGSRGTSSASRSSGSSRSSPASRPATRSPATRSTPTPTASSSTAPQGNAIVDDDLSRNTVHRPVDHRQPGHRQHGDGQRRSTAISHHGVYIESAASNNVQGTTPTLVAKNQINGNGQVGRLHLRSSANGQPGPPATPSRATRRTASSSTTRPRNLPRSPGPAPTANRIGGSGIADFREFTGPLDRLDHDDHDRPRRRQGPQSEVEVASRSRRRLSRR